MYESVLSSYSFVGGMNKVWLLAKLLIIKAKYS